MRRLFLFFVSLAGAAVGAVAWSRRDDLKRTWGEWRAATARSVQRTARGGPRVNGPVPAPGSARARVDPVAAAAASAAPTAETAANENAPAPRCAAETQDGKRCSREAEEGSRYCWQHAR